MPCVGLRLRLIRPTRRCPQRAGGPRLSMRAGRPRSQDKPAPQRESFHATGWSIRPSRFLRGSVPERRGDVRCRQPCSVRTPGPCAARSPRLAASADCRSIGECSRAASMSSRRAATRSSSSGIARVTLSTTVTVAVPRGARHRIEVHGDHPLAGAHQRLASIAVFQRDEDHVRNVDAVGVDESAVRVDVGEHRVLGGHQHVPARRGPAGARGSRARAPATRGRCSPPAVRRGQRPAPRARGTRAPPRCR